MKSDRVLEWKNARLTKDRHATAACWGNRRSRRRSAVLTRKGASNVWEQMLAGGEPKQVTNFTSGRIVDFSWTRDGKTLLLAKGELTRDVVLITGGR